MLSYELFEKFRNGHFIEFYYSVTLDYAQLWLTAQLIDVNNVFFCNDPT